MEGKVDQHSSDAAASTGGKSAAFSADAARFLSSVSDESAYRFGVQYTVFLESMFDPLKEGSYQRPESDSLAQSKVRMELNRIFYVHYGWKPG
jgi:hypothetical protein